MSVVKLLAGAVPPTQLGPVPHAVVAVVELQSRVAASREQVRASGTMASAAIARFRHKAAQPHTGRTLPLSDRGETITPAQVATSMPPLRNSLGLITQNL